MCVLCTLLTLICRVCVFVCIYSRWSSGCVAVSDSNIKMPVALCLSLLLSALILSIQGVSVLPELLAPDNSLHWPKIKETPRSLEVLDLPLPVIQFSSRLSAPSLLKLYPAAGKPSHMHANLPLRFGRSDQWERGPRTKSSLNLPQRFGRSYICSDCPRAGTPPSATLPQRFGRRGAPSAAEMIRDLLTKLVAEMVA
uniref:Uncharacterized protein n=1 Tax=Denticeps clupeoides TaxID=299321 RepID=A0AAY4BF93_9TELE